MISNTVQIQAYKSERGLYLCKKGSQARWDSKLEQSHEYNGKLVQPTHHSSWFLLEGESSLESVTAKVSDKQVNHRWELIDQEDNELGLPLILDKETSGEYYNDDEYSDDPYGWCIPEESKYYKFRTFYHRKYDFEPQPRKEVEFEVEVLGEIDVSEVDNFTDMKISYVHRPNFKDEVVTTDLASLVRYDQLELMLVPTLAIHNRPCSIDRDTTYKIVRNYIRENMDGKYARITSDYDFAFTVKKKIKIKPIKHKSEITKSNGRSYAKPRFKEWTTTHKEVEIFEMCPAKKYQKYTPIEGFRGENLQDLAENVKLYLDELMEVINAPLVECEHCQGHGNILEEVKCNER
ncbi:coil containing protein [Vibrio phage 1.170.O._10N.261.52.C3]|nr:coil containing protein [Vibrio phage 1.170.O._10N.261.52.C3]